MTQEVAYKCDSCLEEVKRDERTVVTVAAMFRNGKTYDLCSPCASHVDYEIRHFGKRGK